LISLQLFTII